MTVNLVTKINNDLTNAMLNANTLKRDTLRRIKSKYPELTVKIEFTNEDGNVVKSTKPKALDEITNDEVLNIISKLAKMENESLKLNPNGNSKEVLEILNEYLPKEVSEEDIKKYIIKNINFDNYKNKVDAMKDIMKHFGKTANGNIVRQILLNM